jgi:hypothetical protein
LPQTYARTRVIAGTRGQFHAHQIGFGLVFASELERGQIGAGLRHRIANTRVNA